MEFLILIVLALLVIAAATTLEPRLGLAAPLVLVVMGIGASFLSFVPAVKIEPEWILAGVLPPLLYSAAVSIPAMEFRRDFTAISGLSVVLVVVSAVVLGAFFAWLIPGLGRGIALGAIVSPTDAVATSIVEKVGASSRVTTVLKGESLINDATALVLLRAAIVGASVSLWGVLGNFVFSVAVAVGIGYVVGRLNLVVRSRVEDATVNTALPFTVPFLASIPAEELGASGLVAAVVAGLVTGYGAPRVLSPQHRLSDGQNWRTVELILEGAVFLLMGLQLSTIVSDVRADHAGIGPAVGIAAAALVLTVLVRAAYVAPLLAALRVKAGRGARIKPKITIMQDRLEDPEDAETAFEELRSGHRGSSRSSSNRSSSNRSSGGRRPLADRIERFRTRLRRSVADIDYFLAEPLGWREGTIIVWAGMRGAITLAAAQTLPDDTPSRSLLVLIAFLVATGSLLLQGSTLPRLVALVKPEDGTDQHAAYEDHVRLMALLQQTAAAVTAEHSDNPPNADRGADAEVEVEADQQQRQADDTKRLTLTILDAQRQALLDARDRSLHRGCAKRRPDSHRRRPDQPRTQRRADRLYVSETASSNTHYARGEPSTLQ